LVAFQLDQMPLVNATPGAPRLRYDAPGAAYVGAAQGPQTHRDRRSCALPCGRCHTHQWTWPL